MIVVGDFGGTHTRFALAERSGSDWRFARLEQQATTPQAAAALSRYLESAGMPALTGAAFCGAGPVLADGSIRLTNSDAVLEPAELAAAAGVPRALLVNDFEAVAQAIPRLPAAAFAPCGAGIAVPGAPRVVLGPGTGLGIAVCAPSPEGWNVIPGEGGHADLAPVDHEELEAWQRLRERHGRVSLETVLSGPGLERLYAAVGPGGTLKAPEIADAAWRGDEAATQVVRLFTRWLGRAAGNLALTAGARGGVYLAGGIIPTWGSRFDAAAFREAFEDKAPRSEWLRGIPGFVVQHPQPGLYGLAVLSATAGG
ncbi:MAG TPA: ROK family protein [Steroidobacteraceae bacterium]|nr:ROK family protein [Steroidobacteraceae bacterium]